MSFNAFHDDDEVRTSRLNDRRLSALESEPYAVDSQPDGPPEGERWSSWDGATHGPKPRPDWVITDLGAVESDLGVLKTGKEADVHLVRRWLPGVPERDVLMAGKRYRSSKHRMFHRDAGYLEGRRVRKSRENRAMRTRTAYGKELISGLWAFAEFETLVRLWEAGLPVPYPVQLSEDEMLMEFIGAPDGSAAPRLSQTRPGSEVLPLLFEQLREAMVHLAELGWAHGDLSPYNVLLEGEGDASRLVIIDWPQIVDVIGNPHGPEFLERDAHNMAQWFTRRGYAVDDGLLFGDLMAAATSRW
ncbi:serine protein kinase RIO [Humibacillus xanthopallidus]|uniref:non-specific serine/threonine protein kinase n=1 Tax=Humibacillus xanthopallidus TaxID=412689 RepID=A0A543HV43_9MICO|nr:RIO1 family regulatory kinase/ATPase [Humibacillus xanthopallidus]TQM62218.1 RIO kinase 1 [Humibacillus xanthopallidus]